MATISPKLLPLPKPDVALINPDTGQPTKEGYDWLVRLQAIMTQLRLEVVGPLASLGNFANDAAAAGGGVPIGGFYRNGSVVQIRVT